MSIIGQIQYKLSSGQEKKLKPILIAPKSPKGDFGLLQKLIISAIIEPRKSPLGDFGAHILKFDFYFELMLNYKIFSFSFNKKSHQEHNPMTLINCKTN